MRVRKFYKDDLLFHIFTFLTEHPVDKCYSSNIAADLWDESHVGRRLRALHDSGYLGRKNYGYRNIKCYFLTTKARVLHIHLVEYRQLVNKLNKYFVFFDGVKDV